VAASAGGAGEAVEREAAAVTLTLRRRPGGVESQLEREPGQAAPGEGAVTVTGPSAGVAAASGTRGAGEAGGGGGARGGGAAASGAGARVASSWTWTATEKARLVAISSQSGRRDDSRRSPTQRPRASLHRIRPSKWFSPLAI
jgi:hypothetical protein